MSAIVGFAGLAPTLAAARAGAIVALANKESLICAGPRCCARPSWRAAGDPGGFRALRDLPGVSTAEAAQVSRLILTASGGPFRTGRRAQMAAATPEQALAHPNWSMGVKISIDSATMMNKGLEVIEAAYLFAMPPERVDVLIHPQSIVHSLVEYADGSTLAQLGPPDMRAPIACAFAWPDRLPWPAQRLDLARMGPLTFEDPDPERFPALQIAKDALLAGGAAPTVMNAADEVAVQAFLDRRIGFLDIASTVAETLDRMDRKNLLDRGDADLWKRPGNRCDGASRGGRGRDRPYGPGLKEVSPPDARFAANIAVQVVPFLLVLGVVVTVHELGHFLAAKALGTKIDQFSIGFGKAIAKRTDKSGVEWRLGWMPIGGYVRFAGDENAASVPDQNDLEALRRDLVAREGGRRSASTSISSRCGNAR
jgi:1-deoxy-D-xylulose-5-phosphate reductoisomerase